MYLFFFTLLYAKAFFLYIGGFFYKLAAHLKEHYLINISIYLTATIFILYEAATCFI